MDVTYDGKDHNEISAPADVSQAKSAPPLEHAYAGFWVRFWAFLLDGIVIGSINRLLISPVFSLLHLPKETGLFTFSLYSITSAVVFFAYFAIMTKFFKQTLGKMVFGLKVVSLVPEKGLPGMWSCSGKLSAAISTACISPISLSVLRRRNKESTIILPTPR